MRQTELRVRQSFWTPAVVRLSCLSLLSVISVSIVPFDIYAIHSFSVPHLLFLLWPLFFISFPSNVPHSSFHIPSMFLTSHFSTFFPMPIMSLPIPLQILTYITSGSPHNFHLLLSIPLMSLTLFLMFFTYFSLQLCPWFSTDNSHCSSVHVPFLSPFIARMLMSQSVTSHSSSVPHLPLPIPARNLVSMIHNIHLQLI